MDQGEEAGAAELKESPLDFALWKARKEGEDDVLAVARGATGAPAGTSSARRWPRSCSALDFEIHSGGSDLVFPHHENEIAQTEAARGVPLARIWMHNGMVQHRRREDVEVARQHLPARRGDRPPTAPRRVVAFLTSGHYRQPIEFSEEALEQAAARVERMRNFLAEAADAGGERDPFVAERARGVPRRARRRLQHAARRWAALFELSPRATGGRCPARARRSRELLAAARARVAARRRTTGADARGRGAARRARAGARRARLRRAPTRSATGSPSSAGEVRDDARAAPGSSRRGVSATDVVYGTQAGRRGAARAARGCAASGRADGHRRRRAHPARRLARPPGRRRRGRSRTPTPTPTRCSSSPTRWSSPSTRSRTRRTSARSPLAPRPRAPRAGDPRAAARRA